MHNGIIVLYVIDNQYYTPPTHKNASKMQAPKTEIKHSKL